jgi:hypothetical protein
VCRRSWNRKPSGSPASATHSAQRADRWKLFRRNAAPFGPLKIRSSGSLVGNSARCSRTTATSTEVRPRCGNRPLTSACPKPVRRSAVQRTFAQRAPLRCQDQHLARGAPPAHAPKSEQIETHDARAIERHHGADSSMRLFALGRSEYERFIGTALVLCQGLAGRSAGAGRHGRVGRAVEDTWPAAGRSGRAAISACPLRPRPALDRRRRSRKSCRGRGLSGELTRWIQALSPQMQRNISTGVLLHPV